MGTASQIVDHPATEFVAGFVADIDLARIVPERPAAHDLRLDRARRVRH
jgi:ABC-type proline/glycine betaine transport system ATPase subunit